MTLHLLIVSYGDCEMLKRIVWVFPQWSLRILEWGINKTCLFFRQSPEVLQVRWCSDCGHRLAPGLWLHQHYAHRSGALSGTSWTIVCPSPTIFMSDVHPPIKIFKPCEVFWWCCRILNSHQTSRPSQSTFPSHLRIVFISNLKAGFLESDAS